MSGELIQQHVTGGENPDGDTVAAIGKAAQRLDEIARDMSEAKATDTARFEALSKEQAAQADILSGLKAKYDEEAAEAKLDQASRDAKAALEMATGLRAPSKAHLIGTGASLVPSLSGYQKGSFITAVMDIKGATFDSEKLAAKAVLDQIGSFYQTPEEAGSKATLGLTDATGGWIIPNAIVEPIVKTGRFRPGVLSLVTQRRGLQNQYQVDIPFRRASASRALVAPWGDTKENRSLTYEGYTATLYTIAAIYDLAKQFVRKSAGAAEQDVIEELSDAFATGESYYTLRGSGSNEPYGLQTALALAGAAAYTSSFSPATTLVGSVASAIATAAGALALRERTPTGALLGSTGYWTLLSGGSDAAGFWLSGGPNGTPEGVAPNTVISPFGIPVVTDNQMAGADDLIVGEWDALKVYFGEGYRVDTSSEAGDRWDKNLIGFRGEEEMGLDARPAVFSGAFQFIADVLP